MTKKKEILLIIICWVAYVLALLGRFSYSSNVTLIMDRFSVEHAEASLPSTLFFFAYGLGQIVIGLFCHKFNRRLLIIVALLSTGLINLIIFLGAEFYTIKYLWLVNGLAQANLWPVLLLILRENISKERIAAVSIVMATASTGGKFTAIGVCAIFAIDTSMFMYCFLTAGIVSFIAAILFFLMTKGVKKPEEIVKKEEPVENVTKQKVGMRSIVLLILLGEFSFASYAISGGLQSWVPSILKENYDLSDALSIFMSVMLPLFTLSVALISPLLNKLLKNHVLISFISFVVGAVLILVVYLFLDVSWILAIVLFTVEAVVMSIISNTTTVQVPLTFEGKFDAGFLAGFLNGACYIGSAAATYVLGAIADTSGWASAFILLIALALFSGFLAIIFLIYDKLRKKRSTQVQN